VVPVRYELNLHILYRKNLVSGTPRDDSPDGALMEREPSVWGSNWVTLFRRHLVLQVESPESDTTWA
jgi:hypothetical protein